LSSGKLGGVALDVFEREPCQESPLFGMPGVLCTPHLGASTEEAQTQVAVEAVNLLISYLTTGEVRHAVNVAAIDPATLASLKGFLNVAYRLGMFLSQCHTGSATACRLLYRGLGQGPFWLRHGTFLLHVVLHWLMVPHGALASLRGWRVTTS